MSIAQELAKRILAFKYDDLPEEAIFWAKQAITALDAVTNPGLTADPSSRCRSVGL